MIRLPLIIATGAVAVAAAVTPAVIGLTGNPSFSQQVPVHAPAHARVATFSSPATPLDDRSSSSRTTSRTTSRSAEPGDDHGRDFEPSDDHARNFEPGDDHGGGESRGHGGGDG